MNILGILCFIISKKVNATEMQKKTCAVYEKVLCLIECVKSGLWSFLVLLTFWPNNSLLWGCLLHWKMSSKTPGLCPLEVNNRR